MGDSKVVALISEPLVLQRATWNVTVDFKLHTDDLPQCDHIYGYKIVTFELQYFSQFDWLT